MAREAWRRWGAEDERGAPNWIGADDVARAASLVRSGKVLSLAQPISTATPIPAHRPGFMHFMGRDGGDYAAGAKRPGGFQFSEDTIVLSTHTGTHVDALCHCWYEDRLYNGFSGDTLRSTTGAQHCGVEKLPPIVARGVLLDVARLKGGPLTGGTSIGRADLEAAANGVDIGRGDAVLIRTGWLESEGQSTSPSFDTEPGIDVEAGLWLAEAGVALVGADNFAIEAMPFSEGTVFPVHQRLIRDYGIPLLEGLVLAPLAQTGVRTFLFVAAPLPIVGATGSPLNPLAVL